MRWPTCDSCHLTMRHMQFDHALHDLCNRNFPSAMVEIHVTLIFIRVHELFYILKNSGPLSLVKWPGIQRSTVLYSRVLFFRQFY